jgi:predicted HicB family RNase H-like nuclease
VFEGSNFEELEASFHRAVDGYLEVCEQEGKEREKPYSGKILIRIDPEPHREVVVAAAAADMSMNKWLEKTLKERIRGLLKQGPSLTTALTEERRAEQAREAEKSTRLLRDPSSSE